jgi:uncharacterized membrane protein
MEFQFLAGNEEGQMLCKRTGAIAAALVLGVVIAAPDANADFFERLGFLPGYDYSEAVGISANGKKVAGNIRPIGGETGGTSQAFVWTNTTGMVGLGYPTRAFAISGDGSTVVGSRENPTGAEVSYFVWKKKKVFGPIRGMPYYGEFVPGIVTAFS